MKRELLILVIIILFPIVLAANDSFYFTENTTCSPNWICADWSPCLGNNQVRTCYDNNTCGDQTNKPAETRACGTTCTPSWECEEWQPIECKNTTTQTRNCVDTNYCNLPNNKPAEIQTCELKSDFSWIIIFIIVIVAILILGTLILLYKKLRTKKSENKNQVESKLPKSMDETYSNTPKGLDE